MIQGQDANVTSLQICSGHRQPMRFIESIQVISNMGIEGDRHSKPNSHRQILLVDNEILQQLSLSPGNLRENVTTTGIPLSKVCVGDRIQIGKTVILEITGPCAPCSRMDEIRPGLQDEITRRRGILAWVVEGGVVKIGDLIKMIHIDVETYSN